MVKRSFTGLPVGVRIVLAILVTLSFSLVFFAVPPQVAEATSCPPGWTSCTSWAPDGSCCKPWWTPSLITTEKRTCTTWDHDINAYPTCTYKVVARWDEIRCVWPVC